MDRELHLFIIWNKGLFKKEEIVKDIDDSFYIRNIFSINWRCSKDKYKENIQRFYGVKLNEVEAKIQNETGYGDFLAIIVYDEHPKYAIRNTSRGKKRVNIKMFDKKEEYRSLTGGGTKVHCTNDVLETDHDLTLLFGKNSDDFVNCYEEDANIKNYNDCLFGSEGFRNLNDLFYLLNNCDIYCILRNFESIIHGKINEKHTDIDIISSDSLNTALLLNGRKNFEEFYRVSYSVMINGGDVDFDLRDIKDGYYCEKLSNDILRKRELQNNLFVMNKNMYFYTLLYHALFQKNTISKDYKKQLKKLSNWEADKINDINYLLKKEKTWLEKNGYSITIPLDSSVDFNYKNAGMQPNKNTLLFNQHYKETLKELAYYRCAYDEISNSKTWNYTKPVRLWIDKIKGILNVFIR